MAKDLHIETLAEGVESEQQARLLSKMGCESAQGFFFGRPQPAEAWETSFGSHSYPG